MKQHQSQSGSIQMAAIILLALALVLTLGFVFWQNFIDKQPVAVGSAATSKPTKASSSDSNPSTKSTYLMLDGWGVKLKLPAGVSADQITYYDTSTDAIAAYEFSTKRVEAFGSNCVAPSADGIVTRLGTLSRSTTPDGSTASPPTLANKFGGYYYYVHAAQSTCADSNLDAQVQDRATVTNLLSGVEPK